MTRGQARRPPSFKVVRESARLDRALAGDVWPGAARSQPTHNADAARFGGLLPQPLASTGAPVASLDRSPSPTTAGAGTRSVRYIRSHHDPMRRDPQVEIEQFSPRFVDTAFRSLAADSSGAQ